MSSSSAAPAAPVYSFGPVCLESSAEPLDVTLSYMTHSNNIHTKEFGLCSGVGGFLPTCMRLVHYTHSVSWHTCSKCKYVAFLRALPPLSAGEEK